MVTEFLLELIKVHSQTQFAGGVIPRFSHAAGEKVADFGDIVLTQVRAVHLQFIHGFFSNTQWFMVAG
jgi:hypothetical protein